MPLLRASALLLALGFTLGTAGRSRCARAEEPAVEIPTFSAPQLEFVEREVRPLLVERCHKCHGEIKEPKGGLRLVDRASALKGGESGPAAIAGKPADSYLIQSISYTDAQQMPPDGKLSDAQIATLTKWVELGLPWPKGEANPAAGGEGPHPYLITDEQRQFWAFQKVAVTPPPAVAEADWPRGDIDRYLLARLEKEQLGHAPPADKRTLIRRATFDLTGLPPTPADVQAFLADESAEAFSKLIDRLLASPQYGERWGRHWLDVARYTDSGDARDLKLNDPSGITEAWRYRDWVVAALNRDLPYDQFVVNQLAGDLLEPATADRLNVEGQVATGFLAIGPWGNGDADKEKMLTDIVDDQLNATSRAFLGLTVTCARCHDHKFDPIPTADYYSLAGIFYSTHIIPDVGAKTAGAPMMRIPLLTANQLAAREADKKRLDELKTRLTAAVDEDYRQQARNLLPQSARYLTAAWDYENPPAGAARGPIDGFAAGRELDPRLLAQWVAYLGGGAPKLLADVRPNSEGIPGVFAWTPGQQSEPVFKINSADAPAIHLSWVLPPHAAALHPSPTSNVVVAWRSPIAGTVRIRGHVNDGDPNGGNGVGWTVARRVGHATQKLATGLLDNGGKLELAGLPNVAALDNVEVRPGDFLWLSVSPRGEYSFDTTIVELEITETAGSGNTWSLARDVSPDPLGGAAGNPHRDALGNADVWHFFELPSSSDRAASVTADSPLGRWFAAIDAPGSAEERRAIAQQAAADFQRAAEAGAAGDANFQGLVAELTSPTGPWRPADTLEEKYISDAAKAQVADIRATIEPLEKEMATPVPLAHGALEGGVPGTIYAGVHDAKIQIRGSYLRLSDSVPRRFPRILAGDDQTPITEGSGRLQLARWIATADNPLTARVMVNRIWQHHFGEGIVRSANNFGKLGDRPTNPELLDYLADRLVKSGWSLKALHREIMTSAAYQQSSLGDPHSAAHDPDNRFLGRFNRQRLESEAIRDSLLFLAGRLDPALGGPPTRDFAAPRRTMYLMTIRSDRSGFGPLFDGADPLLPVEARNISTVAPQSLFLLNNEFVIAQAGGLADRILAEPAGEDPDRTRIERLYELLFARGATEREQTIGRQLVSTRRLSGDERSAWLAYCQVLLCTNELVYVD